MLRRLAHRPVTWVVLGVLVLGAGFGLFWFQPWKLFTSNTVNEVLPTIQPAVPGADPTTSPDPDTTPEPANALLASGMIITHEHESTGQASLVRLVDGRVQLVFQDLATSDGPDLHVWLTDQPVVEGRDGWHVFDDGRYVELGPLKANRGNQVYDLPAGTDLDGLRSVSIWCKRFAVSFGAARLDPA